MRLVYSLTKDILLPAYLIIYEELTYLLISAFITTLRVQLSLYDLRHQ